MRYLIIGNGPAGINAINGIRELDPKGEIIVISDEGHLNYSRPLISYLLGNKIKAKDMSYCDQAFYKANRVKLILNKKATKLNIRKKEAILSDKKKLPFDKLLISTGANPIIPDIKGKNLKGVFTFTKLQDATEIARYVGNNRIEEAVIIGGGLIGLKAAEALMALKIRITIIELADRILSSTFDRRASDIIKGALEKERCSLITNNTICEIRGKGDKVSGVVLEDKREIFTSLVIMAIGTRPNIDLISDSSIKTDKGIIVDEFMQTSIQDIYAAGDCCQVRDLILGVDRPIAIWPNATRQGRIAGFNIAFQNNLNHATTRREYKGAFAMNSVELCSIPSISVGLTLPHGKGYDVISYCDQKKSIYKKLILKDNIIVGAIFIGDIDRAGVYTGLIRDSIDVTNFREHLLKEDFGLINLPSEYRKHLVAGEVAII